MICDAWRISILFFMPESGNQSIVLGDKRYGEISMGTADAGMGEGMGRKGKEGGD